MDPYKLEGGGLGPGAVQVAPRRTEPPEDSELAFPNLNDKPS